jgi:anti-anti-sigma regulatory factor
MATKVTVHRVESRHLLHTEASRFRHELLTAIDHGPQVLLLDLSAVESIDSECLGLIILVARLLPKPSLVFLVPAMPQIRDLSKLLEAQSIIEFADSLESARNRIQEVFPQAVLNEEVFNEENCSLEQPSEEADLA